MGNASVYQEKKYAYHSSSSQQNGSFSLCIDQHKVCGTMEPHKIYMTIKQLTKGRPQDTFWNTKESYKIVHIQSALSC